MLNIVYLLYFHVQKRFFIDWISGTENIQLDNYPSKELQFDWLREYLKTYNHPAPVEEDEITELYIRVNKFSLMAHIFWGLWSLIQAANSKIDFDFIE